MKKLILTTLIASSLFSSMRAQEAQSILVVDVGAIMTGYYDAQTAEMKFNNQVQSVNAKITDMGKQLQSLQEAAAEINQHMLDAKNTADGTAMYKKELDDKGKEFSDLQNTIQDFRTKNLAELNDLQNKIVSEETDKVKNAVAQIAAKHHCSLVLNCTNIGAVVYHQADADITSEVLALLNQGLTPPPTPASTLPTAAGSTGVPALTLPSGGK